MFDPEQKIHPIWLLIILGPLGSLAGFAALLSSNQPLSLRAVCTSILCSGLLAVAICVTLFSYYGSDIVWLPVGVSILSGFGGVELLNFLMALAMKALKAVVQSLVENKTGKPMDDDNDTN